METGTKNSLTRPAELLGRAIRYERANWRRLMPVVAIYAFGGLALQLFFESGSRFMGRALFPAATVLVLAGAFLYVWGFVALLLALRDDRLDWRLAYQGALSFVARYAVAWLLYALIVTAGVLVFVVPGIYAAVLFSFVSYVLVFENTGALEALRRSRAYVRGHWWAVLWREIALGLMAMGAYLFVLLVLEILRLPDALKELLLTGANTLVVPVTSVYVLLMYRELKSLHHGKNSD
ncbi:MAG: hypothetical protein A2128_01600 [Candidatus Liptonbacteria bacterium GWC1_60_9]|uniref:Glycerophosphoryl diester phosphodiesterase membrane domain-containing protein n=3 Tax=Candidatus Liptoniibacteriota TaxID=1817909 RepID=A0A1G2CK71_9BACT|nr:MAG: hypothetical protein UZ00_C0007G0018 [Parcubacteria group bacterium GW2011_GWA1_60_11]OGY97404.1 MAG: hypothetical protein A2128_01600 [Candidatus Liptonbacteria bacterium GWC1_60_9]OGY99363.1 MAG: hypothetical protein A3E09_01785 [Candidatus Liptonbacteria bacterium RIFCSPHIGHO2_12_FULL_60_13]OGZ01804.1 MAG: hypothetical protein A3G64_00345 [Candidatus Liptonbacteria bacterium RIFCSPLOWO2_12_FULL_60_15]